MDLPGYEGDGTKYRPFCGWEVGCQPTQHRAAALGRHHDLREGPPRIEAIWFATKKVRESIY
jgi:hypothetical protein